VEIEATVAQLGDITTVFEMIPVRAGETVYDVVLQADDLDSGAGLVLDVGDGDVTDRYIDGSTIGQTGGTHPMSPAAAAAPTEGEFPRRYTGNDTIDVAVQVAAGTAVAGTIRLTALVG
jgi:hypothetical protein